jgi:PAS domain S-box-containing protein
LFHQSEIHMLLKDVPIRQKLMTVILLTSGAVLLLTCTAFFAYEFFTFRQTIERQLSTLGEIIATNSTAALAFDSPEDATEILGALKAEKHIIAASLYDEKGKLFSYYPSGLPVRFFSETPQQDGYRFERSYLSGFQPVILGNKRLGTLYLKSDMGAMRERFQLYAMIVILVIGLSFVLAYVLSLNLQRRVSQPIVALAEMARAISYRKDYGVRATKTGEDELGDLTDAFNQMLTQIQEQNLALSQHKERLENIVESMGDAYVSLDRQWVYTFVNSKAGTLMGKRKEELIGKTLWETFPDTKGTVFETEYRCAMEERVQRAFEVHYQSYLMWLEVRAYPHEDGIAIFYTDITKYRKAEEEIKVLNSNLEQKVLERTSELKASNEELESFSYSVSHDLRAPLRSIHGYMKIFKEDYSNKFDQEATRLIDIVLENGKRMGQLIDELLEFSRLGRRELMKANISMRDIVALIWDESKRAEPDRQIEFNVGDLPMAYADSTSIRQVWTNLISNALKYTRVKSRTVIEIGFQVTEKEIIYFVKDNGAGFDMRYYDKLFGVFQRLHKSTEFEGTGVGLAIVHRIVSKHGGRVWAEAIPNVGATFYFSLATGS